jgi:hypothetical protein
LLPVLMPMLLLLIGLVTLGLKGAKKLRGLVDA